MLLVTTSVISITEWSTGVYYNVNDLVTYNGNTYKCLQAHTSQAGWTPSGVPALWQQVADIIDDGSWQVGVQYNIGDRVLYNGLYYRNIQSHTSQSDWTPPNVPALWVQSIDETYSNELKDYLLSIYGDNELKNWNINSVDKSIKIITYDIELQNQQTGEIRNVVWYKVNN